MDPFSECCDLINVRSTNEINRCQLKKLEEWKLEVQYLRDLGAEVRPVLCLRT